MGLLGVARQARVFEPFHLDTKARGIAVCRCCRITSGRRADSSQSRVKGGICSSRGGRDRRRLEYSQLTIEDRYVVSLILCCACLCACRVGRWEWRNGSCYCCWLCLCGGVIEGHCRVDCCY